MMNTTEYLLQAFEKQTGITLERDENGFINMTKFCEDYKKKFPEEFKARFGENASADKVLEMFFKERF